MSIAGPATATAKPGRPRCFCEETALDAAMRVFWEKGFEGASLTDLTEAMGINRPSLYAAFGDKQALFFKAMERYAHGPAAYLSEALAQPTARAVIETLLRGALKTLANPENPRGCFSIQGAIACGPDAQPVKDALVAMRKQSETALQARLERAQREGDLAQDVDTRDVARYLVTVISGLGIQAVDGATEEDLTRIVDLTLRTLPIESRIGGTNKTGPQISGSRSSSVVQK